MSVNDRWLSDSCLQIIGENDKGTLEYIKSIAKKANTLDQLQKGLNDFDIPTADHPRNKVFATTLFEKFGSRTITERKENAEVKKKAEYSLVEMDFSKGKKNFIGDH